MVERVFECFWVTLGGGGLAVDIWRVCCELVEGRRRRGLNGDWRL